MIPQDFIQTLLARIDIVDVVERYLRLKKAGANYKACCPFHNEKTPSFNVSATKQFYHCFGCGAHGNAIGFVMEYSGLTYPDAIRELAQQVGLEVPEVRSTRAGGGPSPGNSPAAKGIGVRLMEALTFYRAELRKSPAAIDYLKGRGLTGEIAARYGLGYAPDQWQALQGVFADYDASELKDAGLVIDAEATDSGGEEPPRKGRRYDRFRGRIMFPILDARGNVLGFGGRVLGDGQPKYLNSPETPVFEKGRELYGLYQARRAIRDSNRVLVVEGYMDVVALAQHGVANVVATLGTATTPMHLAKLLKLADDVVFCFDGDAAGRKAAWRALEVSLPALTDGKSVSFLFLPPEDDPDTYVRRLGKEGFETALAEARPLSQVLLGELASGVDLRTEEGRARLLAQARPLVAQIVAPAMGALIRRRLAELTGVEVEALPGFEAPAPVARRSAPASPSRSGRRPPSVERQLLARILRHPSLAAGVDAGLVGDGGPDAQALRAVIDWVREGGAAAPTLGQLTAHFDGTEWAAVIDAALQEGLLDQLGEAEVDLAAEVAALAGRLALGRAEHRKAELEAASLSRGLTPEERAEWAGLQARQAAAKGVEP